MKAALCALALVLGVGLAGARAAQGEGPQQGPSVRPGAGEPDMRREVERLVGRLRELLWQAEDRPGAREGRPAFGEPDDPRGRLRQRLAELAARARELEPRVGPDHPELARVRQEAADVKQKIQELERQAQEYPRGATPADGRPPQGPGEDPGKRARLLRAAADNLRAAGANDLARQVQERAEGLEQRLRNSRPRPGPDGVDFTGPAGQPRQGPGDGMAEQVQDLRRQVEQLRAEVRDQAEHLRRLAADQAARTEERLNRLERTAAQERRILRQPPSPEPEQRHPAPGSSPQPGVDKPRS